jgi:cell division protein FtsL
MSAPARTLPSLPAPAPARGRPQKGDETRNRRPRRPARTPNRGKRGKTPTAARRKRHHLGFVLFASLLVGLMVVGLVALNAFLAQSSFRIQDLEDRIGGLSERQLLLEKRAAHLSAPGRIAEWARQHGMRLPDDGDIHILHVRGGFQEAAPAGEPDSRLDGLELKPILEASA